MVGEEEVERQFYQLLLTSNDDDAINRGYHLYYYGDVDIQEEDVPRPDDGSCIAVLTLRQLARRLGRCESRHLRLRRIELLTVRRFLETGRKPPADSDLRARVVDVLGSKVRAFGDEFAQGIRVEGTRVLELLAE
jgi:hypothetical protein